MISSSVIPTVIKVLHLERCGNLSVWSGIGGTWEVLMLLLVLMRIYFEDIWNWEGSGQQKDFLKQASTACFCAVTDSWIEIMARLLQTKLGCEDTRLFAKCVTLEAFFNSSKTWDNRFVPRGSSLCAGATSVLEQCWRGCARLDGSARHRSCYCRT